MMGNHWIGERSPTKLCLQKCRRLVWFSMLQRIPLADQTVLTTNRRLVGDHGQSFADHRKPPKTTPQKSGCRRSARGCRCNSLTTNCRLVSDHRQTFADLWQPLATTQKSGCQRSATGCRYSVTGALTTGHRQLKTILQPLTTNCRTRRL